MIKNRCGLCGRHPAPRAGRRFRKSFKTQGEAVAYERWIVGQYTSEKDWIEKTNQDNRILSDLADLWYRMYGISNKFGKGTHRELVLSTERLNNPIASQMTAKEYVKYHRTAAIYGQKNAQ